jgi:hypothetical protein
MRQAYLISTGGSGMPSRPMPSRPWAWPITSRSVMRTSSPGSLSTRPAAKRCLISVQYLPVRLADLPV